MLPTSFPAASPYAGAGSAPPRAPHPQRHRTRCGPALAAAVGIGLFAAAWPATTVQAAPASQALGASTCAVASHVTCHAGTAAQATATGTPAAATTARCVRTGSESVEVVVVDPGLTTAAGGLR
ncbi:hypothetical protein ACFYZ8_34135 [Streptomyces sp. NPDC001668]|uniref:hypothetical protein n=1 Tax=Streptomyces sp. NPDC001668 TaxID=3364598 RepID=UPI00367F914E